MLVTLALNYMAILDFDADKKGLFEQLMIFVAWDIESIRKLKENKEFSFLGFSACYPIMAMTQIKDPE
jgi:hypothetical protein